MKDVIDDLVEELPVVADEQQRVAIAAQEIGEPQRGFEIEVIGRLVEQQQLGLGEEHAGKRDTHAPAAGEIRQRLILLVVVEAETREDAGGARFRRMRADCGEPLVDFRDARGIGAVLGLGEEALALVIGSEHGLQWRGRAAGRFLRDEADTRIARQGDAAAIERTLAADQIEQRRFARAVAADQPDFPAIGICADASSISVRPAMR